MVIVPRNHRYKWFAVMVFTLSRWEHGWFRRNSVCCGPVYGPWLSSRFSYGPVYDSSKPAGRFRSGLHSTSFLPNCDISHAFNFRHAFTATHQLFYISTSTVSPAAALLCRLHILEALAASFLLRSNGTFEPRHPWFNFRNTICSTLRTHACQQDVDQKRQRRKVALRLASGRFDPVVKTGNKC